MEWDSLEHTYTEKTNDWYAWVIVIAGGLIAVEFISRSYLLIVLIVVATVTIILMSAKKPGFIHVSIRPNGILVGNKLHPYSSLDGFAIIEYTSDRRLLLESNRHFLPLFVIHLPDDLDHEELHATLIQFLPEKELHESLPHILLERLGF